MDESIPIKLVIVGDGAVGKTSMLCAYIRIYIQVQRGQVSDSLRSNNIREFGHQHQSSGRVGHARSMVR